MKLPGWWFLSGQGAGLLTRRVKVQAPAPSNGCCWIIQHGPLMSVLLGHPIISDPAL